MLLEPDIIDMEQSRRVTPAATLSIALHGAVLLALVFVVQSQISQFKDPAPKTLREVVLLPDMRPPTMGGGSPAPPKPKPIDTPVVVTPTTPIPTVEPTSITPEPDNPAPVVAAAPGPAVATGPITAPGGTGDGTGTNPAGAGPGPGGPVYGIGNGVSSPTPIRRPAPQYTAAAMKARLQGIAVVTCVVRPDGACSDIRIVKSLEGLDEQAIANAKQWRFRPGMRQGEAVPVQVTLEIEFNIR
jgi:protein TonB